MFIFVLFFQWFVVFCFLGVCVFFIFWRWPCLRFFLNSLTNKFKHKWVYHSSHTLYTIADTHSKARRIAETISSKRKFHKTIFYKECAHVSTCFPSRSCGLLLALYIYIHIQIISTFQLTQRGFSSNPSVVYTHAYYL